MKKKTSPPATPSAAAADISTETVLRYQIKEQQGRTLRTAEQLLGELEAIVKGLRKGSVPTNTVNASTVAFLIADHAKLVTLKDTLELIEKP